MKKQKNTAKLRKRFLDCVDSDIAKKEAELLFDTIEQFDISTEMILGWIKLRKEMRQEVTIPNTRPIVKKSL